MDEDFDIVPATPADRERIAEFLRQNFYTYEPLNLSLGAPPNRPTDSMRSINSLPEGTSLMTMTKSGLIIGVSLNGICRIDDEIIIPQFQHEAYRKVFDLVKYVEKNANIWKHTGEDSAFFVHLLAVDPMAGGRGIGKALVKKSREIAKSKGYPLFGIMCTSHYSARIARSVGMDCVYKLPYTEYKDEKGVPIFTPAPPHKEVAMFVQKINSEN